MKNYLEFENDVKDLEEQLEKLKDPFNEGGLSEVNTKKLEELQSEIDQRLTLIYSNLSRWQKTLVSRHEDRPKAKYFIENIFSDFINLSGDRHFADDKSVLAGFATIDNQSVLVIGQEKGNDLDSRINRNFGMMRPEGYRKCIRLMRLAEKFNIPVVTFIDTPGAYPGVGAEQRGQAEAIASSIDCCMSLKVPIISIIIGEGGSGGAIALAAANKIIMLENSIYSVISPEGCASILWKDPKKSPDAAEAMKVSAEDLFKDRIIDEIIKEPTGGAHRDKDQIILSTKLQINKSLEELKKHNKEEILNHRKLKFLKIGRRKEFLSSYDTFKIKLSTKQNLINNFKNFYMSKKIIINTILFTGLLYLILKLIY